MLSNFFLKLINLPRKYKISIILLQDILIIYFTQILSLSVRLGKFYFSFDNITAIIIILSPIIALPIFFRFGLYRSVIRYIGSQALWSIVKAVCLFSVILGLSFLFFKAPSFPRSVIIINAFFTILLLCASRLIAKSLLLNFFNEDAGFFNRGNVKFENKSLTKKNVLIIGAGKQGIQIANTLSYSHDLKLIGFIDEDQSLIGQMLDNIKVYSFEKIQFLIDKYQIKEFLVSIPFHNISKKDYLVKFLENSNIRIRILPDMEQVAQGNIKIDNLPSLKIEDLLGRESVPPNPQLLKLNIEEKNILVTGAGGSIGSELCKQIIKNNPKKLVLYELNEYALYKIEMLLNTTLKEKNISIEAILGSINDKHKLEYICKKNKIHTIYHSAAYKHVPMVEKNIFEAVENNVFGTLNCAKIAAELDIETFVLISTDKAVRPSSIMGVTKRFAELIVQSLQNSKTRFVIVRFGNVLDSSGSVIPLFRNQIDSGGPVTVTDPKVIRYFMTSTEAAQLVIQAGAMGNGGEVFLLEMGQPIQILEIAKKMINLKGFKIKDKKNPDGDIEIIFTGLRPGEKMFEELLIGDEVSSSNHEKIFKAKEKMIEFNQLNDYLNKIKIALTEYDSSKITNIFEEVLPEYKINKSNNNNK